jgi:hypothetical protein
VLQHLSPKDGALTLDVNDEIIGPMCVMHNGAAR